MCDVQFIYLLYIYIVLCHPATSNYQDQGLGVGLRPWLCPIGREHNVRGSVGHLLRSWLPPRRPKGGSVWTMDQYVINNHQYIHIYIFNIIYILRTMYEIKDVQTVFECVPSVFRIMAGQYGRGVFAGGAARSTGFFPTAS